MREHVAMSKEETELHCYKKAGESSENELLTWTSS